MRKENILLQVQILTGQLATIQDGLKDLRTSLAGESPAVQIVPAAEGLSAPKDWTVCGRVYASLNRRGHGVNMWTLAREANTTLDTVRVAIKELRGRGYNIQTIRTGSRRPIYKLMKRGA